MQYLLHSIFKKQMQRAPDSIRRSFQKTIDLFELDEFNPTLHNHKLHGKYGDCRSININGDWRIVYQKRGKDITLLVAIGTHSQLYGR